MRRHLVTAAVLSTTALALVTGTAQAQNDPVVNPLTCSGNHIQISFEGAAINSHDFYALYDQVPDPNHAGVGRVEGQIESGFASNTFVTDYDHGVFATAYWTWNADTGIARMVSASPLQSIDCRA